MQSPTALIVGASRGLGLALCQELANRSWHVTGTVRGAAPTQLHQDNHAGRITIEHLDITDPARIAALRQRLDGKRFDLLFVNAGILIGEDQSVAEITTEDFTTLMLTNALGPLRVLEALQDLVPSSGTLAVMSSGLGSIAENTGGVWDCYSASKAALNMLMRGFAARHQRPERTVLVMAPGWVRTDMGGPAAPLGIADSIPRMVDTIQAQDGKPGLRFLDYTGRTVAW